jgi:hypothetical protein
MMINKYRAVGGMSVGRGTEIFGENLQKYNVVHQKSHMM